MSNTIPLSAQVECVRREIHMREKAYPRWVGQRRLTQKKADEELAAMRAVLETVERLAASERLL